MRILVVGAGAYVTGRGTEGLGTVLPALAQHSKRSPIDEVVVRATRESNAAVVRKSTDEINHRLGSTLSVRYETSSESLADVGEFDGAIVVVPDDQHFPICASLIRSGVHCLVVKPLTPSLDEAFELVALQRQHGVHAMVEFHKRFDSQNRLVRRLLDEGRLGRLSHANVAYSQRATVPAQLFRGWAESTNIFQYLGVHYVDLLYFLTKFRPERAMAVGCRGVLSRQGLDVDDAIMAMVVWRSPDDPQHRFVSNFSVGWIDPTLSTAESDQRYSIVGSAGRIECDQKNRGLELVAEHDRVRTINPYFSEFLCDQAGGIDFAGYGPESISCFLDDVSRIQRGQTHWQELCVSRPSFEQALVSTAVLEAVDASLASNGAWQEVTSVDAGEPCSTAEEVGRADP